MSLKKQIVLWYTVWTLFLMAIIFLMFFAVSDSLSLRAMRHDVEETLSDAASALYRDDKRLYFGNLDEYDDGVYVLVYSSDGKKMFGRELPALNSVGYQEGQRVLSISGSTWVVSDMMMTGFYIRSASMMSDLYTFFSSDYLPLLLLAPLMVVVSALGGYFIVRRSFRPLEDLINTASDIAGGNDLDKRLSSSKTEEGRALSDSFNAMLGRLDESFKREKEFSDDASHELRTPLAVIRAECEYALSVSDDKSEVEGALNSIAKETDRMTRLVSALLEISRSDKGTIRIRKRDFSISDLLSSIAEEMCEIAEDKGLSFSSSIEDGIIVHADDDMITRAVINLVDNAISYSKENGKIEISLKTDGPDAVIAVRDDGIGISADAQRRIFDRFFQVDKSRKGSSSGLGLAMVKEIARLNGAKVEVESSLGSGSLFTFSLPFIEKN